MSQCAFVDRLWETIRRDGLFGPNERIIVAVSGGPDSMALLHSLAELGHSGRSHWTLHVAHVDHNLRGCESAADAALVKKTASALSLECTIRRLLQSGPTHELSLRKARYAVLEEICDKQKAGVLAVAHHADDNAETILHRVLRGTGVRGLRGMRPSRALRNGSSVRLVRPLLAFRSGEIAEFVRNNGIPFRHDESNSSPQYTRNRIRGTVLPLIREQVNPRVTEALLRLGAQAADVESWLEEQAKDVLEMATISCAPDAMVCSANILRSRAKTVRREAVARAIRRIIPGEKKLAFEHIEAACKLIDSGSPYAREQLPGGVVVIRERDQLIFSREAMGTFIELKGTTRLSVPGSTHIPDEWHFVTRVEKAPHAQEVRPTDLREPGEARLDFDCVRVPLIVRSWQPGDSMRPLGGPGRKKLADLLNDLKIPARRKRRVPVVCDSAGPLWVVPFRIDERAKVTRNTRRVLRMLAEKLPSPGAD